MLTPRVRPGADPATAPLGRFGPFALLISLVTLAAVAAPVTQQAGVHPISGRRYAAVMGFEGASWLDRAEREKEEDPDTALQVIGIKRGSTVADVGAGSGYYTVRLARRVGSNGRVYANDIQPEMIELLQKRLSKDRITNVRPVLGTINDPKLPATSIDLALLVDVYHEFSEPQTMLGRLREALKPGGRLVLLEFRKEDPNVPIRLEHKMTVAEAKLEVEHEGFKLKNVYEDLPWQHILVFVKPEEGQVKGLKDKVQSK